MALISCPECGNLVSERAKHCPHCGYRLKATLFQMLKSQWSAVCKNIKSMHENKKKKWKAYRERKKEKSETQINIVRVLYKINKGLCYFSIAVGSYAGVASLHSSVSWIWLWLFWFCFTILFGLPTLLCYRWLTKYDPQKIREIELEKEKEQQEEKERQERIKQQQIERQKILKQQELERQRIATEHRVNQSKEVEKLSPGWEAMQIFTFIMVGLIVIMIIAAIILSTSNFL